MSDAPQQLSPSSADGTSQCSADIAPGTDEARDQPKSKIDRRLDLLSLVFNGILSLVTIFLGVIAYWQLKATQTATTTSEEALRVSRETYLLNQHTLQISERAWVLPKDASIRGPIELGGLPVAKVTFTNTGHSPALRVKIRHRIAISRSAGVPEMAMPIPPLKGAESIAVIAPEGIFASEIAVDTRLDDAQVSQLNSKEWVITTYGLVTYLDVFDKQHETSFCLMWRNTRGGAMSPCDKWNEAN